MSYYPPQPVVAAPYYVGPPHVHAAPVGSSVAPPLTSYYQCQSHTANQPPTQAQPVATPGYQPPAIPSIYQKAQTQTFYQPHPIHTPPPTTHQPHPTYYQPNLHHGPPQPHHSYTPQPYTHAPHSAGYPVAPHLSPPSHMLSSPPLHHSPQAPMQLHGHPALPPPAHAQSHSPAIANAMSPPPTQTTHQHVTHTYNATPINTTMTTPKILTPAQQLQHQQQQIQLQKQQQQQQQQTAPKQSTPASTPPASAVPSLSSVFSDLDSRFLVNLPDEELASFERIMFQLQQAHWFYLDWYSDKYPTLPRFNYKTFCETYFKHIPTFAEHLSKFEQVYASFNQYLRAVPVCGCILLNPERTHLVMVRSYAGNVWGFPRGKLDANEDEITCAIREVDEEVGFDCRPWFKGYELQLPPSSTSISRQISVESTTSSSSQQPSFLEATISGKVIRLYILQNVPNGTNFVTKTRKEIGQIAWVPISSLTNPNNTKYHFSNMVDSLAGRIKTFVKKLQQGQITGYGHYDAGKMQTQQQNGETTSGNKQKQQTHNQPQSDSGNKSGRKAKQSNQSTSAAAVTAAAPDSQPSARRGGAKSLSFDDHSRNAATFSLSPNSSSSSGTGGGGGWSVEAMFAANAKLGVVSTVQEEKIQLPPHLDAQLDAALKRKQPNQQQQQQQSPPQQQNGAPKSGKKANKKGVAGTLSAPPSDLPHSNSDSSLPVAPSKNVFLSGPQLSTDELDFSPNPYRNFANIKINNNNQTQTQQQTNNNTQTATTQQAQSNPSATPSVAAVLTDLVPSSSKPKKDRASASRGGGKKNGQSAQAVQIPQYRIQKRPTADGSSSASVTVDSANPPLAPPSSSAPTSSSCLPTSNEFQFDIESIMGKMTN